MPLATALPAVVGGICCFACPFFFSTGPGILFLHFLIVNAVIPDASISVAPSLLLPAAAILQLLEQILKLNKKEKKLSWYWTIVCFASLYLFDYVIVLLFRMASLETSLILLFLLLIVGFFAFAEDPTPQAVPFDILVDVESSDLFRESGHPFHCLGFCGTYMYLVVLLSFVLHVDFLRSEMASGLWNVLRGLASMGTMLTPALFGGLVHSLKTASQKMTSKKCNIVHA
ncbi:unnamed protein product [Caenorhabditis auriculariae]|uniref:Uncharacterized protein n=1 Tax=Caenorhabditis auriculariae TaxID=2777116 RepID=A0A8S1H6I6_9PELO|nr:unnamed protein product [Caenorhabditis auriculariae]